MLDSMHPFLELTDLLPDLRQPPVRDLAWTLVSAPLLADSAWPQRHPLAGSGWAAQPGRLADWLRESMGDQERLTLIEGDMLAALLAAQPGWRDAIWGVYGGRPPTYRTTGLVGPDSTGRKLVGFDNRGVMNCLLQYLALGWSGYMPDLCKDTAVMVPVNFAWLAWGWPNLFMERMRDAGSEVILLGPYEPGDPGTNGIDTLEELAQVYNVSRERIRQLQALAIRKLRNADDSFELRAFVDA